GGGPLRGPACHPLGSLKAPAQPGGSRGAEAVTAARAVLAGYRPARAERRPAFDVLLPGGPPERAPAAAPHGSRPPPVGGAGAGSASGGIAAAAAGLRRGATTSRRLVEGSLEAVQRWDPGLGAVVHLMADEAAAAAAGLDAE